MVGILVSRKQRETSYKELEDVAETSPIDMTDDDFLDRVKLLDDIDDGKRGFWTKNKVRMKEPLAVVDGVLTSKVKKLG